MYISRPHPSLAQVVEHRLRGDSDTLGGCFHGKARFIEPDNRVDPLAGSLGESHRNAVRLDRLRDGHRVASELDGEFGGGGTGLVLSCDERPLLRGEMPLVLADLARFFEARRKRAGRRHGRRGVR